MADTGYFMPVIIALVVGITGLVFVYIRNVLKSSEEDPEVKNEKAEVSRKKKSSESTSGVAQKGGGKKKPADKWAQQDSGKQNFSHGWLLTSLKGHSGRVLDMDFSGNGKFLATCAEDTADDLDPGGERGSGNSSGSEGNKENRPEPGSNGKGSGLSRRQKRNRVRREDDSPTQPQRVANTKKTKGGKPRRGVNCAGVVEGDLRGSPHADTPPLKQHSRLNMLDSELAVYLRHYVLSPTQLVQLGYPVESAIFPGRAMIFKDLAANNATPYAAGVAAVCQTGSTSHFDVNAREFVPMSKQPYADRAFISRLVQNDRGMNYGEIGVEWHADRRVKTEYMESYHIFDPSGSDQASSEEASSSSSQEISGSDHSEATKDAGSPCDPSDTCKRAGKAQRKHESEEKKWSNSEEKRCVRCSRGFFVTLDGEYLTQERCLYHWGKLQKVVKAAAVFMEYGCCSGGAAARGCTAGKLHVWNGVNAGLNGPLDSYVRTRPRKTAPPDNNYGVYALDCEMCFTTRGLELTKVTVVGADGRLVYDCLVRPENFIIDYNTRFSGITASDLCKRGATKSLRNVQSDLLSFINANTILIGHGLENDLRALRIIHGIVIDTSVAFPHYYGLPYRRSLKSLVGSFLKRHIQQDSAGHDSFEDARACIELMLWKLRKDFPLVLN